MFRKIATYGRSLRVILTSPSGYWVALFSVGIGAALLWITVPLYLAPLGVGLGYALFAQPAFVLTYFGMCAVAMAARAAARGDVLNRVCTLDIPQAIAGVVGGFLLVAANMLSGSLGGEPGTTGMVMAWEHAMGLSTTEVVVLATGCIGAALVGFVSVCVMLWASRLLKRLSTARALVALTGAFAVSGTLTVACAFVTWWPAALLFACVPALTYVCSRASDRRVPYEDLARGVEGSLALGSLEVRHAWRYALVFGALFLMGGYVLAYAGTYDHLIRSMPWWAACMQSIAVLAVMLGVFVAMQAMPRTVGYALICRVCVPPIAVAMLLLFVPENNLGICDDVAVCATFIALMACDLTSWMVDVCTARSDNSRAFALVRCGMFGGILLAAGLMSYPWAPLDKPKIAMAFALVALVIVVICLPLAEVKALSFSSAKPLSLSVLDAEQRGQWSGVILERGLTAREAEVFLLLMRDLDALAIAEELSVSRATVNTHVQHIYRKFGVHGRKELYALLAERGV